MPLKWRQEEVIRCSVIEVKKLGKSVDMSTTFRRYLFVIMCKRKYKLEIIVLEKNLENVYVCIYVCA